MAEEAAFQCQKNRSSSLQSVAAFIKIHTELKEQKLAYEKEIKLRNEHSHNIEILKEKNKVLLQLLNKYKEENDNKFNIIKSLPSFS